MYLGIDIGTSKVAAVIMSINRGVVASLSQGHGADLPQSADRAGWSEQNPEKLLAVAWELVGQFPLDLRRQIRGVGLTGQMHGVVLCDARGGVVSPLVTWRDQRCADSGGFLAGLESLTGHSLRSGYGCATLAWMIRRHALPQGAAFSATIQDLAVARLAGIERPVTDPTDAASWGLFDLAHSFWDLPATEQVGITGNLLPGLRESATIAGFLRPDMAERLGLPVGVPVAVALGDNQASMLATLEDASRDVALTLGTGGQLSLVMSAEEALEAARESGGRCEARPWLDGEMALVAASLCGGSAWAWLEESVERWLRDLGLDCPSKDVLYFRINQLGIESEHEIQTHPHFLGERHNPDLRGSLEGLDRGNFSLGALARGLARGIMRNLRESIPSRVLRTRDRLVGSGNALRRSSLLRLMAEEEFGLPLVLREEREEAALGAAMAAALAVSKSKK
jgi:sedoheptulokinase